MTAERSFRILWGPSLENTLDFTYPVVGSSPLHWRAPRPESLLMTSGSASVALITGRYYRMKVTAQYFAPAQNFGGTGLQAFIDWAADSNSFTLVPNLSLPALSVPGCYLEGPFDGLAPSLESDSSQTLDLTILHPTQDLGLAWRGLWFEYVAGGSLTDPVAYTFTRSSVGYEVTPGGYLLSHTADNVCDGHYPDRVGGLQTTLLEDAVTNDIANPEDLTNVSWTKSSVTITANNAKAPDQNTTADLVVENTAVTVNHIIRTALPGITIAAGDPVTLIVFLRDAGRFRGWVRVADTGFTNSFGVDYNLHTGVISTHIQGLGTLAASRLIPLAGGWYMIWMRGVVDGTSTAVSCEGILADGTGAVAYTGDGVSGTYVWGMTMVHGQTKMVASYTPTSASADTLKGVFTQVPQAQWAYVKFVETGTSFLKGGVAPGIWAVGCTSANIPAWNLLIVDSTSLLGVEVWDAAGNGVTLTAGAQPQPGDVVEVWALLDSLGRVSLRVVINGGAEVAAGPSSALPNGINWTAWTDQFIGLGMRRTGVRGYNGIAAFKTGPYVATGFGAVTTVAASRTA